MLAIWPLCELAGAFLFGITSKIMPYLNPYNRVWNDPLFAKFLTKYCFSALISWFESSERKPNMLWNYVSGVAISCFVTNYFSLWLFTNISLLSLSSPLKDEFFLFCSTICSEIDFYSFIYSWSIFTIGF